MRKNSFEIFFPFIFRCILFLQCPPKKYSFESEAGSDCIQGRKQIHGDWEDCLTVAG